MPEETLDSRFSVARFVENGRAYELALPNATVDHIQRTLVETGRPYELEMLEDMARRLDPGDTVLDVGANVGNHTIYLAAVVGASVHAFEPNPDLCIALEESVRLNDVDKLVKIYPVGVGDHAAKASFANEIPENVGAQSLSVGSGDISVITVDSLSFGSPVRMIKIDVEGMEGAVLKGAARTISRDRPLIYVECRDEAEFRKIAEWAMTFGYAHWQTYNATPTHLFIPDETLSLQQRLGQLSSAAVIQDYGLRIRLQEKRQALDRARTQVSELRTALTSQVERADALAKQIAERDRTLRVLELEKEQLHAHYERAITTTQNRLIRAQRELEKLHRYGRTVEGKYQAVLESTTWRLMEPVRLMLRKIRGQAGPDRFVPTLGRFARNFTGGDVENGSGMMQPVDDTRRGETVVIFLATYPARRGNLPRTVATLLPQCDLLQVYLNEYEEVPGFLSEDSRILPILGVDAAGDLKDNGKFFGTRNYPDSFHIFVDDDILYPPDYVENLIAGIRQFGHRAVVGYHGTIYNPPVKSYLKDRTVMRFYAGSRCAIVDQLGTGTAGYHASAFIIDLSDFESAGVADLWFAKRAAEKGVPLVALSRREDWLLPMPEKGTTIFRQMERDDSRESALLRDKLAPALRDGPRAATVQLLNSLYTPAHLKRHKVNMALSKSGAFGIAPKDSGNVHFALIVVGWNCETYLRKCLASIERQTPGNYTLDILAYDDYSDDGTWEALCEYGRRLKIKRFRGDHNNGPAFARDALLRKVEDPQTVCVLLDMDDELLPHALVELEETYRSNPDCWMTYGNWINQHGVVNDEGLYSAEEIDSREYRNLDTFRFTHLRSFRRFLYDRVETTHLTDENGAWLRYCSDVALLLPLADQCASKNVVAFERPLYLYNQYRSTGTQKRFRHKKKEMFSYLRDKIAPLDRREEPA